MNRNMILNATDDPGFNPGLQNKGYKLCDRDNLYSSYMDCKFGIISK